MFYMTCRTLNLKLKKSLFSFITYYLTLSTRMQVCASSKTYFFLLFSIIQKLTSQQCKLLHTNYQNSYHTVSRLQGGI